MTRRDIDATVAEARAWMSAKETGNVNFLCTRLARALLAVVELRDLDCAGGDKDAVPE